MPVTSELVGTTLGPSTHHVDERWTMAYAAALEETADHYFDTTRPAGIVAHPLFAVCVEWPVIVSGRDAAERLGVLPEETRRAVHATHDLTVHRLIRPGDTLSTTATHTGVEQRSPGAFVTTRLETRDAQSELVAVTEQGALYLGVPTTGEERPAPAAEPPELLDAEGATWSQIQVRIPHGAAHTYTECARIWNPIHTDEAVARAAGLPGIILHGTATMALAVSRIVDACADGDPSRVRRIVGRFGAQVPMPSTITVRLSATERSSDGTMAVPYDVSNQEGGRAIDRGIVVLG